MKKWMRAGLVFGLLFSLCACGRGTTQASVSAAGGGAGSQTELSETQQPAGGGNGAEAGQEGSPGGNLSLLYHMQRQYSACSTEQGYYALTLEEEPLTDGRTARHLMYMDFATRQEIYLCSNAACVHNTADCTSVFPTDEFASSTALFVWNQSLYIMSKEQDHDGSAMISALGGGSGAAVEAVPAVFYRAGLDGTNREKIYTFDASVTLEDLVVGDAGSLYLITKKVSTKQDGNNVYQTSSERKLIRFDLSTGKETALFSMDFGGTIDWDVIGCTGRKLVLYGIDFGREVSVEEKHADDASLYDNSSDVFATLDVDSGTLCEIYRVQTPKSRSYETDSRRLYYSVTGDGQILSVDLQTAEQKVLCRISQDAIWGRIGDRLYTRDGSDHTLYFIDTDTGEISHCGLVDRSTGSTLKLMAEAGDQVLIRYDSDVTMRSDGSYTIYGYRYALIRREDLFAGRDQLFPIQMTGSGR